MSLIDDAKDLAKQAGSKVADTARDIKDKATDKASDLVDKAGDALDEAKAKADVAKAEAAKKATEVKNDAKEALRENAVIIIRTSPPLAVYYLFAGLLLTYEWGWTAFQSNMAFLLCCIYCSDIRNPQCKEPELEPGTKCNRSISVDWPTAWIDRLRCQTLFCVSATIVAGSKCRNRLR